MDSLPLTRDKKLVLLAAMGVIVIIDALLPEQKTGELGMDKVIHVLFYLFLTTFLLRTRWILAIPHGSWLAIVVATALGGAHEFLQSFMPTGHPSIWDAFANLVGAVSAVYLYRTSDPWKAWVDAPLPVDYDPRSRVLRIGRLRINC